jgi:L,D-transpeptidase YcbB
MSFLRMKQYHVLIKFAAMAAAVACTAVPQLVSLAQAESDTSEQWRLERLNKATGGKVSSKGAKTTSTFHGGGGPAVTETEIVVEKAQIPMLTVNSDERMLAAQSKYSAIIAQGGFPKIPDGNLKKGSEGKAVAALNERLFIEGYLRVEGTQGDVAAVFTTATEDAVTRFQRNMGLAATGRVDNATLAELNVSAEERLRTINVNIPLLEVYAQELGDRYLVVNIPAQQIETVSGGKVFSRHNAIVGRPERPTPVVMTALSDINFNPYWNAPVSIVERDIIPKLQVNPQFLTSMNMKVFQGVGGPEVDPKTVDWSRAIPDDYQFRQEPGEENAMKTAKIEFNSPFGIYLHDTPEPQLFNTNNRFYSSGCIRIQKMPLLVEWVLNGQDGFNTSRIATMAETLERLDVTIADAPQLRVAYLTAWPTANGSVAFRRDIYDLDSSGFTVGQPMPVGETSPEGLRYVYKPLPRQISVETAEAEGFNLFGFKTKAKAADPLAVKKNLFGKSLFSTPSGSTDTEAKKVTIATSETAIVKLEKQKKTKLFGPNPKIAGLFDWAAYRKQQSAALKAPKAKKKVKLLDSAAVAKPVDGTKTKTDPKKSAIVAKPANGEAKTIPLVKAPKKITADVVMADPCAPVNGKIPTDCLPKKKQH